MFIIILLNSLPGILSKLPSLEVVQVSFSIDKIPWPKLNWGEKSWFDLEAIGSDYITEGSQGSNSRQKPGRQKLKQRSCVDTVLLLKACLKPWAQSCHHSQWAGPSYSINQENGLWLVHRPIWNGHFLNQVSLFWKDSTLSQVNILTTQHNWPLQIWHIFVPKWYVNITMQSN